MTKTYPLATEPIYLTTNVTSNATEIYTTAIKTKAGVPIDAMSKIGDKGYLTIEPNSNREEFISFTGFDILPDGTYKLTGVERGLSPVQPYNSDPTYMFSHPAKSKVLFSNSPAYEQTKVSTGIDAIISSKISFEQFPEKIGSTQPTSQNDLATKAYVDSVSTSGNITYDSNIITGQVGEAISAGDVLYFDTATSKWMKASASSASTSIGVKLGIAQDSGIIDARIPILIGGLDKTHTGLIAGSKYYLSDTVGQISTTAGTHEVFIGWAQSNTELLWSWNEDIETVTADEKDALQGSSGYAPSNNNRFIDEGSTSNGATYTTNTIAFVDSNPDTITDSANGFVTAGFRRGQEITVSGSTSNDGTYRIANVTPSTITLVDSDNLIAENAGANVTISAILDNKILQLNGLILPSVDISNTTGAPALDATNMSNVKILGTNVFLGSDTGASGNTTITNTITVGFRPKLILFNAYSQYSGNTLHSIGGSYHCESNSYVTTLFKNGALDSLNRQNIISGTYPGVYSSVTIYFNNITNTSFDIVYENNPMYGGGGGTVYFLVLG